MCKQLHEKPNWMFSGTAQVSHQVCQFFFVSSVCLLMRVTMVDTNKAVVCCLLATSAIMLSERKKRKRKMWSKKGYLRRNISCDAHLLNELLETDVPWDDAIVVSARKLRKLWDFLTEFSMWKTTGKDSSEACAIAYQNCAVYKIFPSGMTSQVKSLSLTECVYGALHPSVISCQADCLHFVTTDSRRRQADVAIT